MKSDIDQSTIQLTQGNLISLPIAQGLSVAVLWGSVWLTQDGDSRDHEVNAGESFNVKGDGTVVISAFENSALTILQPCESTSQTITHSNAGGRHAVQCMNANELQHYLRIAHELRAQYVARLMHSLGGALRRGLTKLGYYASELWLKNLTGLRSDLRNRIYMS